MGSGMTFEVKYHAWPQRYIWGKISCLTPKIHGTILISLIRCPAGRQLWFWPASVKNIVHPVKKKAWPFVPGNQPDDDFVRPGPGMAPRADLHAYTAICSDFPPICKAALSIEFPFFAAVEFSHFIISRDGFGRAAISAFFTNPAKIFHTDVHRFVRG